MSARPGGASATVDAVAERIVSARIAKALALVKEIRQQMVMAVRGMTPGEWVQMAQSAKVNEPSETTQALVIKILEES